MSPANETEAWDKLLLLPPPQLLVPLYTLEQQLHTKCENMKHALIHPPFSVMVQTYLQLSNYYKQLDFKAV